MSVARKNAVAADGALGELMKAIVQDRFGPPDTLQLADTDLRSVQERYFSRCTPPRSTPRPVLAVIPAGSCEDRLLAAPPRRSSTSRAAMNPLQRHAGRSSTSTRMPWRPTGFGDEIRSAGDSGSLGAVWPGGD